MVECFDFSIIESKKTVFLRIGIQFLISQDVPKSTFKSWEIKENIVSVSHDTQERLS